jgi:hypothetical protein
VVATLSGVFRDLLPLQTRMLAEAAWLASTADEPAHLNFVRKHSLAHQAEHHCDMETASLRVFSNAEGAYGANVNQLIDGGTWADPDELADAFESRKASATECPAAPSGSASCCAARSPGSISPIRISTRSNSASPTSTNMWTASAVSAAPSPRQGQGGAGLHSRCDPRRGQGPHARRAGRTRNPHPHAQSALV